MKKGAWALFLLLVLGAFWYGWRVRVPLTKAVLQEVMKKAPEKALQDGIGLALENIRLAQGDQGAELWRLRASFAHMATDGDVTTVDEPVVRYTLGEPGSEDFIHVTADKGAIKDNQRFLHLWGHVVVTRDVQRIIGSAMTYNATTRVMTFPDGAFIESPTASGSAKVFTWNLADNVMTATGAVDAVITRPTPESAAAVTSGVTSDTVGAVSSDAAVPAKAERTLPSGLSDTPKKASGKSSKAVSGVGGAPR